MHDKFLDHIEYNDQRLQKVEVESVYCVVKSCIDLIEKKQKCLVDGKA